MVDKEDQIGSPAGIGLNDLIFNKKIKRDAHGNYVTLEYPDQK